MQLLTCSNRVLTLHDMCIAEQHDTSGFLPVLQDRFTNVKSIPEVLSIFTDGHLGLYSYPCCQGLPISPETGIPVREKAPAMPPASSRCRGSRVGIFPSLCSTPSIQDVQSSQSSTMPASEICARAKHFRMSEKAWMHSCRTTENCSCDRHCTLAHLVLGFVQPGGVALSVEHDASISDWNTSPDDEPWLHHQQAHR